MVGWRLERAKNQVRKGREIDNGDINQQMKCWRILGIISIFPGRSTLWVRSSRVRVKEGSFGVP